MSCFGGQTGPGPWTLPSMVDKAETWLQHLCVAVCCLANFEFSCPGLSWTSRSSSLTSWACPTDDSHVDRDVLLLVVASDHHLDFQLASLDLGLILPGLSSSRHCSRRDRERRTSVLSTSELHMPSLPDACEDVLPGIATGGDDLFQTSYFRRCPESSMLIWPLWGFPCGGRTLVTLLPGG